MATCLEESRLTSVHDRICAKRARRKIHESGNRGQGSDAVKGGQENPRWAQPSPTYSAKATKVGKATASGRLSAIPGEPGVGGFNCA
jgi:hypothetical protein